MIKAETTVDKSGQKVKRMFGEIAPNYDRMNHLLSMNVDRYWRRKTVKKLKPNRQDPILDCCTGTGDLAFALLRETRGEVPVVAADFCFEMLEIGDRKKNDRDLKNITFVEADTQSLPFSDDQFQIVSVAFGLRNVENTDRGLNEMVRVCKRGGKIAILEFRRRGGNRLKRLTNGTSKTYSRLLAKLWPGTIRAHTIIYPTALANSQLMRN